VLADWLTEWAAQPSEVRNLDKLRRSNAEQRHLFIILPGFTTAPFEVTDLLWRAGAPTPTIPPRLPDGITHVWAMSTWTTGDGFFWSAESNWTRPAKITETTLTGGSGSVGSIAAGQQLASTSAG